MWDISTMLGVLGVVLTIVFFVIGYRQTIGARKERAKAANRRIIEAVFRRLVLDDSFPLDRSGIAKVLLGTALTAAVRTDDIYSPVELEAVLYAKSMESDYMDDAKRVEVMSRLAASFTEPEKPALPLIKKARGNVPADVWLAFGSAITAMATILVTVPFIDKFSLEPTVLSEPIIGALAGGLAVVTLTAVALTAFTRLRDLTRRTLVSPSDFDGYRFERDYIALLKSLDLNISTSNYPIFDFTIQDGSDIFAVELKSNVNNIRTSSIKTMISRMEKAAAEYGLSRVYIVSQVDPFESVRYIESQLVKIVSASEFYNFVNQKRQR